MQLAPDFWWNEYNLLVVTFFYFKSESCILLFLTYGQDHNSHALFFTHYMFLLLFLNDLCKLWNKPFRLKCNGNTNNSRELMMNQNYLTTVVTTFWLDYHTDCSSVDQTPLSIIILNQRFIECNSLVVLVDILTPRISWSGLWYGILVLIVGTFSVVLLWAPLSCQVTWGRTARSSMHWGESWTKKKNEGKENGDKHLPIWIYTPTV